ncbi:cation:proton antiporter [Polymorphobacter fuscus]|uniref:Sodium:proton antiporter n=1 Tax=Sandarakinorhabdus fusca TaxID=1439888 RepID=A0A7C9GW01_9SPHN|nr:cation:proton antiporter [Polymorphobacter fuscus]KAB7646412.1 sodium:proton antiporter [Polymorphobacter fuscus]MQT17649.1 sodium:proton antiporter [Polymorphobacter fuscus]NJC09806.1 NhaP-type Na+/H+ or K+/H+ antiporter [Polymorphobacter fuscus]
MYDFNSYHLLLAAIGTVTIIAYWVPRFVSGREPAASALLIGLGLAVFGLVPGMPKAIDPISNPVPWEHISEVCVIVGLFGVGLKIDNLRGWRHWRPTARLLVVAMPLSIAAVAGLGWAIGGMTFAGALLLGAVLAPTDPVLAGDVQVGPPREGGEHPVRFALTTEAGLNDGLAFPFVHLALTLAVAGAVTPDLIGEWLWRDVVYRIVVGAGCGVALGWLLGRILFILPRENSLAKTEAGVIALAGVLAAYGLTELAEGYGFIAAFLAGLTLRQAEAAHEFHVRMHGFSENIEHALTALLLIGLGAALPSLLPALGWTEAAIGLALVFVVRPLAAWVALKGAMHKTRERSVVAFYGVRGVGSIYYLAYAGSHMQLLNEAQLWAIVAFTVLLSTIVHGFTAGLAVERVTGEAPPGGDTAAET